MAFVKIPGVHRVLAHPECTLCKRVVNSDGHGSRAFLEYHFFCFTLSTSKYLEHCNKKKGCKGNFYGRHMCKTKQIQSKALL